MGDSAIDYDDARTITINLDARCVRCRKKGATPSGWCLRCFADRVLTDHLAKGDAPVPKADPDEIQPPLVPMTDQELKVASLKLARKVRELDEMKGNHKDMREEMRKQREKLEDEITATASTIRTQGR